MQAYVREDVKVVSQLVYSERSGSPQPKDFFQPPNATLASFNLELTTRGNWNVGSLGRSELSLSAEIGRSDMQMPSASLSLPHAIQKGERLADAPGNCWLGDDANKKKEKCLVATVTCCGDTLGIFRLASITSLGRLGNERAIFAADPSRFLQPPTADVWVGPAHVKGILNPALLFVLGKTADSEQSLDGRIANKKSTSNVQVKELNFAKITSVIPLIEVVQEKGKKIKKSTSVENLRNGKTNDRARTEKTLVGKHAAFPAVLTPRSSIVGSSADNTPYTSSTNRSRSSLPTVTVGLPQIDIIRDEISPFRPVAKCGAPKINCRRREYTLRNNRSTMDNDVVVGAVARYDILSYRFITLVRRICREAFGFVPFARFQMELVKPYRVIFKQF
ncbi:hypothetical protein CEXT_301951 [Caerostris extrusa]|uniref:Uncharacterized protein n=1 Tax=Caerostris extrusa TaxID=172846 RepID=A0AAV4M2Q3_CAEEX|nr:hypothetical protein CEXT_301951 [Caerostris extrusa]